MLELYWSDWFYGGQQSSGFLGNLPPYPYGRGLKLP